MSRRSRAPIGRPQAAVPPRRAAPLVDGDLRAVRLRAGVRAGRASIAGLSAVVAAGWAGAFIGTAIVGAQRVSLR
jgi:hypothetical protein